jgi:GNAT superfamily N-acetyltransferase
MRLKEIELKTSKSERAQKWVDSVYSKLSVNPFDERQRVMVWGEGQDQQIAFIELEPTFGKKDSVEVKWISSYPQRQGVGTRAMKILQDYAKKEGITLTLYPWSKGKVSQRDLIRFYKKQGFVPAEKNSKNMIWHPEPISEIIAIDLPKNLTSSSEIDRDWKLHKQDPGFQISDAGLVILVKETTSDARFVYAFLEKNLKNPIMQIQMYREGESWITKMSSLKRSFQGSGIGFKVYELLIKKGNMMLMSDEQQSAGARVLWKRLFKTPGITVFGYDPKEKDPNRQYFQVHDLDNTGDLEGATRAMYTSFSSEYNLKKERSPHNKKEREDLQKARRTRLVAIKSVSRE